MDEGIRTPTLCLEGTHATVEHHTHILLAGETGLEPVTYWLTAKRSTYWATLPFSEQLQESNLHLQIQPLIIYLEYFDEPVSSTLPIKLSCSFG